MTIGTIIEINLKNQDFFNKNFSVRKLSKSLLKICNNKKKTFK